MAKATNGKVRSTRKKTPVSTPRESDAKETQVSVPDSEGESEQESAVSTAEPRPAEMDLSGPIDAETHAKYEEIKRGDIHITELQRMSVQELHDVAKREGLEEYTGLKKQELVF